MEEIYMYARITTTQANPDRMDEMLGKIDEIKVQIKALPGIVSSYTFWRSDGQGVTIAVYEDQAAADAASEKIKVIWGGLAEFLTAAPSVEAFDNVEDLMG
jgi:hypothetical protein